MEKFLGQDYPEAARAQFLENNCDAVEEIGYTRRFTPEEMNQKKEELANASIKINDLEVTKREVVKEMKDKMKTPLEERKQLLQEIKQKSEYVLEECYKFIDQEERVVAFYNKFGELVSSRPIMPQEMQKTIYRSIKTGTED